jgi:DNA-binding FadR family transcriptional regulator
MTALAATFKSTEVAAQVKADLAFHRTVLLASGNELLARIDVVLEPALHARNELAFEHETITQFLVEHQAVVEAIVAQDGAGAALTDTRTFDNTAATRQARRSLCRADAAN